MASIRIKRGTRAQVESAKTAGALAAGEPYLLTDAGVLAVGTGTGGYAESVPGPTVAIAHGGTGASTTKAAVPALGAKGLAGMLSRTDNSITLSQGSGTTPNIKGSFVIAPTATDFSFWTDGTKWTKTATDAATCTVEIPATIGLYHIYFDASGVLAISTGTWDITSDQTAPVATVYWDPVAGAGAIGDERHSANRDRQLHAYLHETRGAAYKSGLVGTFANTTLSLTQGTVFDEDIAHTTAGTLTACRLWWRTPSTTMQFAAGSTTPYKATAGLLKYDNAGTLTSVTTGWYVCNWAYMSNEPNAAYPIRVVVGQAQHQNSTSYNAATEPTFPNMSTREWKLLYKLVYRNVSDTTPTFISATDYRGASSIPSAGTQSLPASAVTFVPGGAIAATDVQGALDELDTEKAKVGANSDITSLSGLTTALSVAQGGTGQTTAQLAMDALAGAVTNGYVLTGNGTHVVMAAAAASGLSAGRVFFAAGR